MFTVGDIVGEYLGVVTPLASVLASNSTGEHIRFATLTSSDVTTAEGKEDERGDYQLVIDASRTANEVSLIEDYRLAGKAAPNCRLSRAVGNELLRVFVVVTAQVVHPDEELVVENNEVHHHFPLLDSLLLSPLCGIPSQSLFLNVKDVFGDQAEDEEGQTSKKCNTTVVKSKAVFIYQFNEKKKKEIICNGKMSRTVLARPSTTRTQSRMDGFV